MNQVIRPPKPHIIHSIRVGGHAQFHWLIAEAVDNSLDAKATKIEVSIGSKIVIADNGHAIQRDHIFAPLTIGDHPVADGPRLGRYGVGITQQAIKHGNKLRVESICGGWHIVAEARWQEMIDRDGWYYDPEIAFPSDLPTGTIVTISDLIVRPPTSKDIEKVTKEIAERFYPALASGVVIIINEQRVPTLVEPELTYVIDDEIVWSEHRSAHIRAGLLVSPEAARLSKVYVSFLHRVIKINCGFGTGDYNGIENIFARITLSGDEWKLTPFKDDIEATDDLEDSVEDILRPLLERCHGQSMDAVVDEVINDLHQELGELAAKPPPKKNNLGRQGEKSGKSGRTSRTNNPGPARAPRTRGLIRIDMPDGDKAAEEHGCGSVDRSGKIHRVILPRRDPAIACMLTLDRERRKLILIDKALTLYAATDQRGFDHPIGKRVAMLMSIQQRKAAA